MRRAAATALGEIGDPAAVAALLPALRHRDEGLRVRVAVALGRIGDARALPDLRQAVVDTSPAVRDAAAVAAGCLSAEGTAFLVKMLAGNDGESRLLAARALGTSPHLRAALPLLRKLCGTFSGADPQAKRIFRENLNRIEVATEAICNLPLVASPPSTDSDDLPIPAGG